MRKRSGLRRVAPGFGLPVLIGVVLTLAAGLLAAGTAGGRATASTEPTVADLVVSGGIVVTMDPERRVVEQGAVAVADGEILAVGPAAEIGERYQAAETVEVDPHDLVVPGLVNGHNHAAMSLLRGVADDLKLMDWLENYIFPAEAELVDPEFVRAGTRLAALEMIRTGTTTFTDMYYYEDAVAEVVDEAGLRGILGQTIIGFPAPDHETPEAALEATAAFIDRWREHPRVVPAVAPHAAYTNSPETLRRSAELARDRGVPLLIHVAESEDEVADIEERFGTTPVRHLESLGFLGSDLVAFHAIWLADEEIDLLARRGVGVVHNPESNLKLSSGAIRLVDLRAAGVPVGLGTDGPASNNDLDLFAAITLSSFLQKHVTGEPTAVPAGDAVAMATIEGARALHLDGMIGSLEPGKRADLIVLDGDEPNLAPLYDPASALAYAARGGDVRLTMVDGRILYRDGVYATLDRHRILADARRIARRIEETVGDV